MGPLGKQKHKVKPAEGRHNLAYDPNEGDEEIFAQGQEDVRREGKSMFFNAEARDENGEVVLPDRDEIVKEGRSKFYGSINDETEEKPGSWFICAPCTPKWISFHWLRCTIYKGGTQNSI